MKSYNKQAMGTNYSLTSGFISQKLENSTSIFDPDNSTLFTLNETGTIIFEELKKGSSTATMVKALTNLYEISPQEAQTDLEHFIALLKKNKILVKQP